MKTLKFLLPAIFLLSIYSVATSQEAEAEKQFEPSFKPIVKVLSNFHYNLDGEESAFAVDRAYLGFSISLSENWSGKAYLDFGNIKEITLNDTLDYESSTNYDKLAYLKNAALTYKNGNISVSFGLIGLLQHKIPESYWGHRYVAKTVMDANGMSSSADYGVLAKYKIIDQLSVDVVVRNGEGYKKTQSNNAYLTGVGFTAEPIEDLTLRGYYDYYSTTTSKVTIAHFIGYKISGATIGFEYNIQMNNKLKKDKDITAISGYASYDITKQYQVFGRIDNLAYSLDTDDDKEKTVLITGIQFKPIKQIKTAINYQGEFPKLSKEDTKSFVYLNLEYSF